MENVDDWKGCRKRIKYKWNRKKIKLDLLQQYLGIMNLKQPQVSCWGY